MRAKTLLRSIEVPSSTGGKFYRVEEFQYLDEMGSLYFGSRCNCLGFRNRGTCKHLVALGHAMDAQAEGRRTIAK